MRKLLSEAAKYLEQKRRHTVWMKVMSGLACIVVFCTVYSLILPAITLEKQEKILACPLSAHQHTDACYDENKNLTCGQADYVVHVHDDNCKDENGDVVCTLPEKEAHVHNETCYEQQQPLCGQEASAEHTHDVSCYRKLICGQEESEEHQHSEGCYEQQQPLCGLEESAEHMKSCGQMRKIIIKHCWKKQIGTK